MRATTTTAALLGLAASANAVNWCVKSAEELATCNRMVTIMANNNATNEWECVQEADQAACLAAINAGTADVISVGASTVFQASEDFGVQLVAGEALGAAGTAGVEYHALAIVRANQDVTKGWASLKGLTSCHTGYRKTSGWTVPVGTLYGAGVLTGMNKDGDMPNDIEAVEAFFGKSCAPSGEDTPTDGVNGMCTACKGDCSQTDAEPYQDYPGAVACLTSGDGDIAFTKEGIVPAAQAANYKLVCADGKTAPLAQFATCNLGVVPSHSVMTRGDVPAATLATWTADLLAIAKVKAFRDLFFQPAGVNADAHIFADDATNLLQIEPNARKHIGTAYSAFRSLASLTALPEAGGAAAGAPGAQTTAKWCVSSAEALAKCESMLAPLNAGASLTWSCVQLEDDDKCIDALESGTADAISVGASTAVSAAQKYGSQIVISEDYGTDGKAFATEYFALAIVKKDLEVSGWESLRGKNSCHTGYRKTSGWTMPVGTLLDNGIISADGNTDPTVPNDIYAVKQFFAKSCAPSREEPAVDGKTGICTGCGGDCTWTDREPYQDYPGSTACLKAGAGDIAFTRQGEIPTAEEGDYKLVCADGRTLPMSDFETCNLARVPSHMVLTGGARPASYVVAMAADLTTAAANDDFTALFFAEDANPDGLVFSGDATGLTPAMSSSVVATVGEAYFAYKAITDSSTEKRNNPQAGKQSDSDKNAAIALGVILAVVALASAALIFRMKKSNRRLSKELSKAQGNQQEWGAGHASKA